MIIIAVCDFRDFVLRGYKSRDVFSIAVHSSNSLKPQTILLPIYCIVINRYDLSKHVFSIFAWNRFFFATVYRCVQTRIIERLYKFILQGLNI